jgi:uncharacterized protein DUF4260
MSDRLPRVLLHAEGAAVAVGAVTLYFHEGYEWWLLLLLALAPDLAMLGYVAGPRTGAFAYDVVHTYVGPVLLGAAGVIWSSDTALALALIWLTHIGVDRAVGYGLKYPSGFEHTHLQRV